jgi:hypothetical protein
MGLKSGDNKVVVRAGREARLRQDIGDVKIRAGAFGIASCGETIPTIQ